MADIMNDEIDRYSATKDTMGHASMAASMTAQGVDDLTTGSLENHFLIAMPTLHDPFFRRTVTYICEHSAQGAMGLIINHPIDINVGELLDKIDIDTSAIGQSFPNTVFSGGPVQTDRGFVLHSPQMGWNSSLKLSEQIMVTTSKDILEAIATNNSPENFIITLGYSGWTAGQLEQELSQNSWLTIPADPELLFHTPPNLRWEKAADKLGIDMRQVSSEVGHA
jgi:putative transcriptional regulator